MNILFSQNGLKLSSWNLYLISKIAVQPLSAHTRLFYNYLFGQLKMESSGKIIKTSIYFKQMLLALLVRFTFEIQCKIKQKSNNKHKAHHNITLLNFFCFLTIMSVELNMLTVECCMLRRKSSVIWGKAQKSEAIL